MSRLAIVAGVICGLLMAAPAFGQKRRPSQLGAKEESPARPQSESPNPDADRALLRALLWAFEPSPREIRIIAIGDLALLGDPRALDALAQLLFHPDPQIALAATRAVTHFQHRRAEAILRQVIRGPAFPESLKLVAVEGLPFQASPTSRALLDELSSSSSIPPSIRTTARTWLDLMASTGERG